MGSEQEMRERELGLLIERISDQLDQADRKVRMVRNIGGSVEGRTVEQAGLDDLHHLRTAQNELADACRILALAMDDRGTPTAAVARALGVSRGTVINWRKDRDERELDPS